MVFPAAFLCLLSFVSCPGFCFALCGLFLFPRSVVFSVRACPFDIIHIPRFSPKCSFPCVLIEGLLLRFLYFPQSFYNAFSIGAFWVFTAPGPKLSQPLGIPLFDAVRSEKCNKLSRKLGSIRTSPDFSLRPEASPLFQNRVVYTRKKQNRG